MVTHKCSSERCEHPSSTHSQVLFQCDGPNQPDFLVRIIESHLESFLSILLLPLFFPTLSKMYRNSRTTTSCIFTFSSPRGPVLETKGRSGVRPLDIRASDSQRLMGKGGADKNTHTVCPPWRRKISVLCVGLPGKSEWPSTSEVVSA